ncbi:MAG: hypothetical protein LBC52_02285 [Treponema sp.]|jgi:hypothetical protein|nr:hypothetical protein [Treponema sp.]
MGTVDLPKSVKTARPQARGAYLTKTGENRQETQPSAKRVESELRGSLLASLDRIIREQSGRFLSQLGAKLPADYIPRDEKVYNFINQNYRIFSDSFLQSLQSHGVIRRDSGAAEITAMLESSGGTDQFNTGEIEKSASSKQWGIGDLETHTDNMLRQNAGVGAIVDSQKANLVVACVFKDNAKKPKTVTDLRLSVNIPETELIDFDTRFMASAAYLIREIICKHLYESIDNAEIFKTGTKDETVNFLDSLLSERLEINPLDLDEYLQNIDRSGEIEEIRDKGFSSASNLIVSILNEVNLDCQFLENLKDRREILIREYADTDDSVLPDERYQIRLRYFSNARLLDERAAYDGRLKNLSVETLRLWDLLEVIYQDSKSVFKVNDFEDLVRKNKNRMPSYDPQKHPETLPAPAQGEQEEIRVLLARMEERIRNISDSMYPVERQITEERLSLLEKEFSSFENRINPHNLQPGILVDIDLTSIKRKRTTLDSISAVLGRFLDNVAGCFRDT